MRAEIILLIALSVCIITLTLSSLKNSSCGMYSSEGLVESAKNSASTTKSLENIRRDYEKCYSDSAEYCPDDYFWVRFNKPERVSRNQEKCATDAIQSQKELGIHTPDTSYLKSPRKFDIL